ncbi:MAG: tetratricopeptide repeat protein [Rhodospirillales bacterium]|nr:tetratricopeptide repeat protein [Rhodospirillales bacterium]
MRADGIAEWVRGRLLDLLPGWLDPYVAQIPDWLLIVAAPTIVLALLLLALRWGHGLWDAGHRAIDFILGKRKPEPATAEGQAAIKRLIEDVLAKLQDAEGRPLSADAEAARESAVSGLVTEDSEPAREAVRDFTAGDLREGLDVLERQARGEQAQAAGTWRRLGALATGVDTTRALAAYEQAFRLEPTDFWTCVFLARLRAEAGNLRGAHDAARAAAAAASTERERAVADSELGDVLVVGGDLAGAKDAYEESLALAERLAADNPGSAEAQCFLSVSLNKLGDVLVRSGDLAGAKARYEAGLALMEHLAADSPGNAETRRDVSMSLINLGDVLVKGGDLAGAKAAFEESLAVAERLVADNPGSAEARRDVSVSLERLGDVLVAGGDLAGAKAAYEEILAVAKRLAADDPGSALVRRDVSVSLNKLGDVLFQDGDLAGAKDAYEESLALRKRLAADNPGSAEARRDVSVCLKRLGDVLHEGRDLTGAKDAYEESLALRERLAADNPGSAEARRDVLASLWGLAEIERSGVTWAAVAERLEAMQADGTLFPADERFLAIARERSGR